MIRTVAGWWVLGLVLSGLVAGSAVFGPDLVGSALRQSPPVPPAVGTCVDQREFSWIQVSCAQPHHGEIVAAVGADDVATGSAVDLCGSTVRTYVGVDPGAMDWAGVPASGEWAPPEVWVEPTTFDGPDGRASPGWSWQACVATPVVFFPADGRYPGSLSGINQVPVADRPSALRRCHELPQAPETRIPCDQPHRGEMVAVRLVVREYDPTVDAAPEAADSPADLARCTELVDGYLGTPVGGRPGALRVEITQVRYGSGATIRDGVSRSYLRFRLSCLVEVVGEQLLTASVAGLGSGALPRG